MNAKGFYQLLYSIALRTLSLTVIDTNTQVGTNVYPVTSKVLTAKGFYLLLYSISDHRRPLYFT